MIDELRAPKALGAMVVTFKRGDAMGWWTRSEHWTLAQELLVAYRDNEQAYRRKVQRRPTTRVFSRVMANFINDRRVLL